MHNKGQAGIIGGIFLVLILMAGGFLLLYLVLNDNSNPTGNPVKETPNLIVENSKDCLNQEDPFGPFNYADCSLNIRNLGTKSVELTPEFKCWKLSNPSDFKIIKVSKDAIASGSAKTFSFSYNNGGREWSCQIDNFNAKF